MREVANNTPIATLLMSIVHFRCIVSFSTCCKCFMLHCHCAHTQARFNRSLTPAKRPIPEVVSAFTSPAALQLSACLVGVCLSSMCTNVNVHILHGSVHAVCMSVSIWSTGQLRRPSFQALKAVFLLCLPSISPAVLAFSFPFTLALCFLLMTLS